MDILYKWSQMRGCFCWFDGQYSRKSSVGPSLAGLESRYQDDNFRAQT
jgi:hypothetical protein